jgi:hypothetical protein
MKKIVSLTTLSFVFPLVAFAQVGNLAPIQTLLVSVGNLVSLAIPIGLGLLLLWLIWTAYEFMHAPDKHRGQLIAGVIAFFVVISIWGLVRFLQVTFLGGTSSNTIPAPHFPTN